MSRRLLAVATSLALAVLPPAVRADDDVAAAIRAVVEAGAHAWLRHPGLDAHRDALRALYAEDEHAPRWVDDGEPTDAAKEAVAHLAAAAARGLDPADYDADRLAWEAERLQTRPRPGAADAAQFDVGLTVAVMRYARDAYVGRVDAQRMGFGLRVPPKTLDVVAVVRDAADDAPAERLTALDPPLPPFARLVAALAPTRELAAQPDVPAVPALPTLREGDRHPGLAAVRTWLTLWRDLEDAAAPADPALYDPPLAAAVRRFQRRHGRADDGVIGPTTLRDLQVPPAQRVTQIELALERLRWLPARFADRFIVVNVPEFRLRAFEHGSDAPRLTMDVVVGSAARGTETPIMSAAMRAVIFRPSWTVPTSIARNEILPLAARDPSYLERQNMELVDGVVRQRPGPNNALGLVKFELPNPYHVYLHDTPAKALFRRSRRDFSHGCIRVADAVGLAEFALDGTWDRERILTAMQSGPEQRRVALPAPIPIYLLYATAVADGGGRLHFYEDIYGHDARLARALATRYQDPALCSGSRAGDDREIGVGGGGGERDAPRAGPRARGRGPAAAGARAGAARVGVRARRG